jgi:hypothetical protein
MVLRSLQRWFALACAVTGLCFMPGGQALAAKKKASPPPEISAFEVEPVNQVAAGTELFFRVEGSAGGRATVRVAGVSRTLVLQEVDDGVYEGGYVLRANDRANAGSTASATLRRNGRSTTVTMGRLAAAAPAQVQPQAQAPRPPATLAISKFNAVPVDKFEPGAELKFQLEGTPGARATFSIDNVIANVPMREASPGHYEGSYTIRRLDRVPSGVQVVATLEANGQAVKTSLGRASVLQDVKPPVVRNLHPRDGDMIPAGATSVSGTFDDQGGLGVDPKSVRITVGGRDVTAASTITREYFTYRTDLNPGSYAAEVNAKDAGGNAVKTAWSWVVQPSASPLPLEITSHSPNATVPAGRVELRGRTAPGATVSINAVGLAAVAGMIGISQPLYKDSTTADNNGNFSFAFTSPFTAPGMRYEIALKAEQGGRTKESTLVLFHQR